MGRRGRRPLRTVYGADFHTQKEPPNGAVLLILFFLIDLVQQADDLAKAQQQRSRHEADRTVPQQNIHIPPELLASIRPVTAAKR